MAKNGQDSLEIEERGEGLDLTDNKSYCEVLARVILAQGWLGCLMEQENEYPEVGHTFMISAHTTQVISRSCKKDGLFNKCAGTIIYLMWGR